jgi:FHS family glucose/mannose:H+ symporter-like MFS transporter
VKTVLRLTQWLASLSLGLSLNLIGPLMPAIRAELRMSYWESGLVLSGQFLGMLFTVPFGGHLADRLSKRRFLVASSALVGLGLAGYGVCHSFPVLLAASVLAGIGNGGYEVGVNALEVDRAGGSGAAMNLLHFFYGVGAIAGPLVAALIVRAGLDWRLAFVGSAILPALVGLALLLQAIPRGAPLAVHDPAAIYRSGMLWRCAAVITLYVGLETSVAGWIATFWARRSPGSDVSAPMLVSLFWITLTAGRFAFGPLADRMGLLRFLGLASGLALLVCAVWAALPLPAVSLAAVLLLGGCLAGIFPTTMAYATAAFPGHSGKVVALLSVSASVGGFVFPTGAGRLADTFGNGALPPLAATLALALGVGVWSIQRPARSPAARAG